MRILFAFVVLAHFVSSGASTTLAQDQPGADAPPAEVRNQPPSVLSQDQLRSLLPNQPSTTSLLARARSAGSRSAVSVSSSNVGYIDNALVGTQIRVRYDSAYGNNLPDRAEYFYAKCGCFGNPFNLPALQGALDGLGQFDADAPGPPGQAGPGPVGQPVERNVDYQEFRTYMEWAPFERLSGFVDVPVRIINPEVNINASGFSDLQAGFKYALVADQDQYVTLQFKTYLPTGNARRGLGTDHVSLEPGLLFYRRVSDRLTFEGEFKDWIGIPGNDFTGNVISYGLGFSYDLFGGRGCDPNRLRIIPVLEVVGWTILDGLKVPQPGPSVDATGDTIVNAKLGGRVPLGNGDIYVGYGRRLTDQRWYHDILRIEYRYTF